MLHHTHNISHAPPCPNDWITCEKFKKRKKKMVVANGREEGGVIYERFWRLMRNAGALSPCPALAR